MYELENVIFSERERGGGEAGGKEWSVRGGGAIRLVDLSRAKERKVPGPGS